MKYLKRTQKLLEAVEDVPAMGTDDEQSVLRIASIILDNRYLLGRLFGPLREKLGVDMSDFMRLKKALANF